MLVLSAGTLFADQKTGWFVSKIKQNRAKLTQSQIKQQRLEAIDNAIKGHQLTYKFEVSGSSFLTMPMVPEEEKVQSERQKIN
ncbi:MAG: hypothetical protein Q8M92_00415 [Candidatus Subteraquimicrobiales bacterium]|nr:hypothetical protein [Candidatus Subteraquimicrobiales bacterium]